jgi:hypothetical protein
LRRELTENLDSLTEEEILRVKLMNEIRKQKQKVNIEAPVNNKEELIHKLETEIKNKDKDLQDIQDAI